MSRLYAKSYVFPTRGTAILVRNACFGLSRGALESEYQLCINATFVDFAVSCVPVVDVIGKYALPFMALLLWMLQSFSLPLVLFPLLDVTRPARYRCFCRRLEYFSGYTVYSVPVFMLPLLMFSLFATMVKFRLSWYRLLRLTMLRLPLLVLPLLMLQLMYCYCCSRR